MTDRKVLLLVTGMTPQIITETVWALACDPENPNKWIPDEIRVISTQDGLNQITARLFDDGVFQKFISEYPILKDIKFNQLSDDSNDACFKVIRSKDNEALIDLKTPEDNKQAANKICNVVRELTSDPETTLHVSIAGGRKTMGFYAGYALSLYGRTQDRMSHVLVDEKYEKATNFFYKTKESFMARDREGKAIGDARDAKIWLANIPFVRLHGSLPQESFISTASFSDVVKSINLANHPEVIINVAEKKISVGSLNCVLAAREFAFYWWFAATCVKGTGTIVAPNKEITASVNTKDEYPELIELADSYLSYYARLKDEMSSDSVQQTLRNGMERSFFDERMTSIKKNFKQTFGADVTAQIEIANLHRATRKAKKQKSSHSVDDEKHLAVGTYGLTLDGDQIVIHEQRKLVF